MLFIKYLAKIVQNIILAKQVKKQRKEIMDINLMKEILKIQMEV
jgi:hypothetical protein